jgi:hypothetical protein
MAGENSDQNDWREALRSFLNPVVLIAISILVAIFVLIGSAIFGLDKGVLVSMGRADYARGLITYLFAVVTIGTAVVLVVSGLTGTESNSHKERFNRGKEVLSLLLGVFGTIVGFYFGSEVGGAQLKKSSIQVAPPHLSAQSGSSGAPITVDSYVSGGVPPYVVSLSVDGDKAEASDKIDASGWYSKILKLPAVSDEKAVTLHVVAIDADGNRGESYVPVVVKPDLSNAGGLHPK